MQRVKTHRFKGRKYRIEVDEPFIGLCSIPKRPKKYQPSIRLSEGLPSGDKKGAKLGLITLIHECLHAENWQGTEKRTDEIAREIGGLLWRLGFRRKK